MSDQPMIPILEFDPEPNAVINPHGTTEPIPGVNGCVITFFSEVVETFVEQHGLVPISSLRSEMGEHPVYQIDSEGVPLGLFAIGVGAPLAAAQLEELIARGYRNFMVCGSAGVLNHDIQFGKVVVCTSAVRDEGTSYHYLPPGFSVDPDATATETLVERLEKEGIAHIEGRSWTNDAFFRETPGKVSRRREQGCLTVEMEASALFAVMHHRSVRLALMLYGGDDVSGATWDPRQWRDKQQGIRARLVRLAMSACRDLVQSEP